MLLFIVCSAPERGSPGSSRTFLVFTTCNTYQLNMSTTKNQECFFSTEVKSWIMSTMGEDGPECLDNAAAKKGDDDAVVFGTR